MLAVGLLSGVNALAFVRFVREDGLPAKYAELAVDWEHACMDLQAVLDISNDGDSICVAEGIYWPTQAVAGSANPRAVAFIIDRNISLTGGFPNNLTGVKSGDGDRDPEKYKTVLSGNFGRFDDEKDNAFHVVWALDLFSGITITIDGFTIQDGYFGNDEFDNLSSGLRRSYGSGMYLENVQAHIKNVTFENNDATSVRPDLFEGAGGAIYVTGAKSVVDLDGVTFTNNKANYGGAVYCDGGNLLVKRVTFTDNTAVYSGGAVFSNGEALVYSSLFLNNKADRGGVYGQTNGASVFLNCTFLNNTAETDGDVYYSYDDGSGNTIATAPAFLNSIIANFKTTQKGLVSGDNGLTVNDNMFKYSLTNYANLGVNGKNNNKYVSTAAELKMDLATGTIQEGSPAINRGNKEYVKEYMKDDTTDLKGASRTRKAYTDIGAYETDFRGIANVTAEVLVTSVTLPYGDSLDLNEKVKLTSLDIPENEVLPIGFISKDTTHVIAFGSSLTAVKGGGGEHIVSITAKNEYWEALIPDLITVETLRRNISVSAEVADKDYDGTRAIDPASVTIHFGNLANEDSIPSTHYFIGGEFGNASAGQDKPVEINIVLFPESLSYYNYNLTDNPASATASINRSNLLVIPDDGQSKGYRESDPVLTFTTRPEGRESTLSGSLDREAGEDMGSYKFNLGTLSNDNYDNITLDTRNDTVQFAVTKYDPKIIWPDYAELYEGQSLLEAVLAEHLSDKSGKFVFERATVVPIATSAYTLLFIPADTAFCNAKEAVVKVNVIKAGLKTLDISDGTLTPAFNSGILKYTVTVPAYVANLTITATADDATKIDGGGQTTIALKGDTTVFIKAALKNGKAKETVYTIAISGGKQPEGTEQIVVGSLKVYPSVTTGIVNIESATGNVPEVKVYDLTGKQRLIKRTNLIDLSAYPQGMYFLQAEGKAIKVVKR